jgi:Leucine-rich repeat (LRR) protein
MSKCVRHRTALLTGLTVLLAATATSIPAQQAAQPPPELPPLKALIPDGKPDGGQAKPLPENVVKAWTSAGAQVGWMRINSTAWRTFELWGFSFHSPGRLLMPLTSTDVPNFVEFVAGTKPDQSAELPAFRFLRWQPGLIASLPEPDTPFGLDLTGTEITDFGLRQLSGLKQLRALNLASTQISDRGLNNLVPLSDKLEILNLGTMPAAPIGGRPFNKPAGQSPIGRDIGRDLEALSKFRRIRVLGLARSQVSDDQLRHVGALENLEVLNLVDTSVTIRGLRYLSQLKRLQAIYLGGPAVPFDAFFPSPASADIDLKVMEMLASLSDLQELSLPGVGVRDAHLAKLNQSKRLKTLNLGGNKDVTNEGIKVLAAIESLEWLNISSTSVNDEGLKHLGALPNLRVLVLASTAVSDEGLSQLAKCKNLQVLDLSRTRVTDDGLTELAKFKNLQLLDLSGTAVTDAGLNLLGEVKTLRVLNVSGTRVTPAGVATLQKALPNCRVVSNLSLSPGAFPFDPRIK